MFGAIQSMAELLNPPEMAIDLSIRRRQIANDQLQSIMPVRPSVLFDRLKEPCRQALPSIVRGHH